MKKEPFVCPKCGHEINLGVELGKRSVGAPRYFSPEERKRRSEWMKSVLRRIHPNPANNPNWKPQSDLVE